MNKELYNNEPVFCIGTIVNIDENYNSDREVDVKCWNGKTSWHESCSIVDPFGHWDGDGISFTPRVGAVCIVGKIPGFSSSLILGFVKLPNKETGTVGKPGEDVDYQGDFKISTIGGNFIKWHSGGAITIEASPTCNTEYLPLSGTISNICRIFDIQSDVGRDRWENFEDQKNTRFTRTIKRLLKDTAPCFSQTIGFAGTSDEIMVMKFGDGLPSLSLGGLSGSEPVVNEKLSISIKKNGDTVFKYKDSGTQLSWNEFTKKLAITVNGDVESNISKTLNNIVEQAVTEQFNKTWMVKVKDQVDIQSEKINIGTSSLEKMTKGETSQKFLDKLLDMIISHTHNCAVGATTNPMNATQFTQHKQVDLKKILSVKHSNE